MVYYSSHMFLVILSGLYLSIKFNRFVMIIMHDQPASIKDSRGILKRSKVEIGHKNEHLTFDYDAIFRWKLSNLGMLSSTIEIRQIK